MKLTKIIQRKIKNKLGFINGWSVTEEIFNKIVSELTDEIILTIEQKWNKDKNLNNCGCKE